MVKGNEIKTLSMAKSGNIEGSFASNTSNAGVGLLRSDTLSNSRQTSGVLRNTRTN